MEKAVFSDLRNIKIEKRDYKDRNLWTEKVIKNTDSSIVFFMDDFEQYLRHNGYRDLEVVYHCFADESGHVGTSRHYAIRDEKGNIKRLADAVDFHIKGNIGYLEKRDIIVRFLESKGMFAKVGFGLYPNWNNPGFHIDLRGYEARWGGLYIKKNKSWSLELVKYAKAEEYARKNSI